MKDNKQIFQEQVILQITSLSANIREKIMKRIKNINRNRSIIQLLTNVILSPLQKSA